MLTTRLWMGSVLIALVVGMLVFDQHLLAHPFQAVFQLGLATLGCIELFGLLGKNRPAIAPIGFLGLTALNLAPWLAGSERFTGGEADIQRIWAILLAIVVVIHLAIFLWEMAIFTEPGTSFERMARTWWVVAYLGLLPSFFAQIRWLYPMGADLGTAALALAVFVPKGCDIGAYFTGRLLGRHPMTPVLSPKKTWEGAIGGLVFAVLIAIGIDRFGPVAVLRENLGFEIAFGLTVGGMGMLGDLAESLMKRDCQKKDASQTVPGFGGVLDVVDAVIFAAPAAYAWFLILRPV